MSQKERPLRLSALLRQLAEDESRARISIGDLLNALGDRALGALLFFFAFPNVLPTPPGTSALLGTPLAFLSLQLTFGKRPWLPRIIASRALSRADFAALMVKVLPWLEKAERLLRPRMTALASPPTEYVIGMLCLVLAVIMVLPIPLGNVLPALAISLMALGIAERDGLWVLWGLLTAIVSVAVVSGVIFAMFKAALFLVQELIPG